MTTAAQVLATAVSQIGTVESPAGSNRQKYGAAMGLNGQPWCAIFQWWCFKQNGIDLDAYFSIPSWQESYCPDLLNEFRGHNLGHTWPDVQPGDLAFYSWNGGSLAEHVGIVESVNRATGRIRAIEGNTAIGNDSNGGQVLRRVRDHNLVIGFGRFPFAPAPQPSGDDMTSPRFVTQSGTPGPWYLWDGFKKRLVAPGENTSLLADGIVTNPTVLVKTPAQVDAIPNA